MYYRFISTYIAVEKTCNKYKLGNISLFKNIKIFNFRVASLWRQNSYSFSGGVPKLCQFIKDNQSLHMWNFGHPTPKTVRLTAE